MAVVNCTILIIVWANPFDESKKLDGLSSNFEQSEQVKNDLFEVGKVGKKQYKEFIEIHINRNTTNFFALIKRNTSRSFDSAIITRKIKVNGREKSKRSDRGTFARLLVVQRVLEIREVPKCVKIHCVKSIKIRRFFWVRILLYSDQKKLRIWTLFTQWSAAPLSLYNPGSTSKLSKTAKSKLFKHLHQFSLSQAFLQIHSKFLMDCCYCFRNCCQPS